MIFLFLRRGFFSLFCLGLVSLCFSSPVFAQFAGYQPAESSAYNSGLFSQGAGLRHEMSNLSGNHSFLISHKTNSVEAGFGLSSSGKTTSAILLNGGGFYKFSENWGVGVRFKPVYNRFFPGEERLINYAMNGILSYKVSENIYLGLGVGPAVSNRPGGFSSYSWNVSGSVGIILGNLNIGLVAESPGVYRFENYLGSEKLKERLPEKAVLGAQYRIHPAFFLYGEFGRVFWERAMFSQNGLEERPGFRVRASYTGSIGAGFSPWNNNVQILAGIGTFANPTSIGILDPVYGASLGINGEVLPSILGKGYFAGVYLQRTGINQPKEYYERETRVGFQFYSRWGDEASEETSPLPKN
ncbi:hypothetical protein [Leptospira idonii]|uniref:Porin n=1 Tax=Leptospira idonii TaxID=1193500 RepID=A0A4R9LYD9_9LEPT|nr:hypothetical protein [Leptospira idonii]TGN18621.1 hypothetical protein EHS15_14695 [Leptospira idonii]